MSRRGLFDDETGSERAAKCGGFRFCVRLSDDREIFVLADHVYAASGALTFEHSDDGVTLILAAGEWRSMSAASVLDGCALALQYVEPVTS